MMYNVSQNWSFWGRGMFSEMELECLHNSTLDILENTGVLVEEEEALRLFAAGGADVNRSTGMVRIPKWMVEEAIITSPRSFRLAGRMPESDYMLENGRVGFTSISVAVNVRDMDTQEVRPSTKNDLEVFTHIMDQLEHYNICLYPLLPTDVPAESADMHALQAYLENTTKHVMLCANDSITAQAIIALAAEVVGGRDKLKDRPILSVIGCPKSPLSLSTEVTVGLIACAKVDLPVVAMPMALSGGTGPVTLAGTLVQHNAEVLSCLVLSQLVKKGAPFIYGSCTTSMDVRRGQCTTGSAEHAMFAAGTTRLSQYYKLPYIGPGTWTDSKINDMQAGYEKALSTLLPALAGSNLLFGGGCQTGGLVADFATLVADNDLFKIVQFILRGIPLDEESLALKVIKEVGPQNEYMTHRHTLKNMRSGQCWPEFFNRDSAEGWKNKGRPTVEKLALEKAKTLRSREARHPLPAETKARLADIIKQAEKEKGVK